jgi:hypothetical protein
VAGGLGELAGTSYHFRHSFSYQALPSMVNQKYNYAFSQNNRFSPIDENTILVKTNIT